MVEAAGCGAMIIGFMGRMVAGFIGMRVMEFALGFIFSIWMFPWNLGLMKALVSCPGGADSEFMTPAADEGRW